MPVAPGREIQIDGSYGEGGGQLLRTAVALAAITGRVLHVHNVRAKRPKSGLAPQHLAAVRAVGALCGASVNGLDLRSTDLTFAPGELRGGRHAFDIGTAGSITLVLQAMLPVLVACGRHSEITVHGGTDVRKAPPLDYFREVTLALLEHMGIRTEMTVRHRGYFPRGGGEVTLAVAPGRLRPLAAVTLGPVQRIHGLAHVAGIDIGIAVRMRDACLAALPGGGPVEPRIEIAQLGPEQAVGAGGAIVAWAQTGGSIVGAGRVAERGIRAETLGSAVGTELRADLESGAAVDLHAADQILIYLALARGGSFSTRALSSHAQTAIWLIEQFLPMRFETAAEGSRVIVRVASVSPA